MSEARLPMFFEMREARPRAGRIVPAFGRGEDYPVAELIMSTDYPLLLQIEWLTYPLRFDCPPARPPSGRDDSDDRARKH
jgi:hypothetical protein